MEEDACVKGEIDPASPLANDTRPGEIAGWLPSDGPSMCEPPGAGGNGAALLLMELMEFSAEPLIELKAEDAGVGGFVFGDSARSPSPRAATIMTSQDPTAFCTMPRSAGSMYSMRCGERNRRLPNTDSDQKP